MLNPTKWSSSSPSSTFAVTTLFVIYLEGVCYINTEVKLLEKRTKECLITLLCAFLGMERIGMMIGELAGGGALFCFGWLGVALFVRWIPLERLEECLICCVWPRCLYGWNKSQGCIY
jgi:hypothetical protein